MIIHMQVPAPLRAAAALMILIAPFALLWTLVASPMIDGALAHRQAIKGHLTEIAQAQDLIARKDPLRAERDQMKSGLARLGLLHKAPNASQAAAGIQTGARTILNLHHVTPSRTNVLPPTKVGVHTKTSLQYAFTSDIESLADLLYALEIAAPAFFVENLQVTSPTRRMGQDFAENGVLNVELTLYALTKTGKARP